MNTTKTLVRDHWMMVMRGAWAVAFGVALLGWEQITLATALVLFAAYVFVDGVWTIITASVTRQRWSDVWPVALEGVVSTAVGVIALGWPLRVTRDMVAVIIAWAVVTGVLEIITALRTPRDTAGHWLFATGGLTSLSLALLLVILPHTDQGVVARLMGCYALVFGVVMMLATERLSHGRGRRAARVHGRA
jgi:uncharacterized membrane protein HdeD (DUF308 family)